MDNLVPWAYVYVCRYCVCVSNLPSNSSKTKTLPSSLQICRTTFHYIRQHVTFLYYVINIIWMPLEFIDLWIHDVDYIFAYMIRMEAWLKFCLSKCGKQMWLIQRIFSTYLRWIQTVPVEYYWPCNSWSQPTTDS